MLRTIQAEGMCLLQILTPGLKHSQRSPLKGRRQGWPIGFSSRPTMGQESSTRIGLGGAWASLFLSVALPLS